MKMREEIKNKEVKLKRTHGITLIALVITIVVLLILAAVSIATLTGQNGILTRADEASEQTKQKTAEEKVAVEVLGSYGKDGNIDYDLLNENLKNVEGLTSGLPIDKLPATVVVDGYEVTIKDNGDITVGDKSDTPPSKDSPLDEAKDDGMLDKEDNTTITIGDDIITIPGGFKVAEDSGNTIDEGIVIEDRKSNQFVWVPVSQENFETEFVRRAGYSSGTEQSTTDYGEANAEGINVEIDGTKTGVTESSTTVKETKEMYASVKRNEGFYIGRYESGKDNIGNVVVQKGANVYNNVPWSKNGTMNEETATGNTQDGAIELARNFDTVNNYKTVTSTLCYGVQWDAALTFIDPEYTGFAKNSDGMGWYNNNYAEGNADHKTGIDIEGNANSPKNIYDLAGNVYEWTMESYLTYSRTLRGSFYNLSGSGHPASDRNNSYPSVSYSSVGFRVTLYL
jgi:flagellar basal body-associated protein FliL